LSGHFSVLKNASLVTSERNGTTIIYRLNMSVMEEALAAFMSLAGVSGKRGYKAFVRKNRLNPAG
jgi:hypothetical protein